MSEQLDAAVARIMDLATKLSIAHSVHGTARRYAALESAIREELAKSETAVSPAADGCARLESESRIVGDSLVISIRICTLAHAARESDYFWRSKEAGFPLAINDEAAFAKSVRRGLNRESEDGSTPITRLLDDTTEWVCDQGEDGVDAAIAAERGE